MKVDADRQRAYEATKLRRLSDVADRAAGDAWLIEADDRGMFVVSERFDGTRVTVCKFGQQANDDEIRLISEALESLMFFLPMIDRAAKRVRELDERIRALEAELEAARSGPAKPKDYAAQASMLLSNGAFQRFLSERRDGEVVDEKDSADAALKDALGIQSKREINNDDRAREAWLSMRAEFEAWKTGATQ